jgi:8-oxo-dGTP pyrophosphatase MutT (NUDIX family)
VPAATDLELLVMQRATRAGDPWSGQLSFPGGRWDPGDGSLLHTALREMAEETGLALSPAQILGELDELRPRTPVLPPIIVRPFVAALESVPQLAPNEEVADLFWVPLSTLLDPARRVRSSVMAAGLRMQVEGIDLDGRLLWGMTDRILQGLAGVLR